MGTYDIAGFTVGFLLHCVERLSPQLVVAHHAGEALHVEDLVHGRAASAFPNNILPAAGTAACHQKEGTWVSASSHPQLQRGCSCTSALKILKFLLLVLVTIDYPKEPEPQMQTI